MRVFATMDQRMPLVDIAAHAQRVERLGYTGLHVSISGSSGLFVR
jgi:hypothetical protein